MTKPKNFLPYLAAILVVALGVMAYIIYNQNRPLQSPDDKPESIEKDLNDMEMEDLDRELIKIESD